MGRLTDGPPGRKVKKGTYDFEGVRQLARSFLKIHTTRGGKKLFAKTKEDNQNRREKGLPREERVAYFCSIRP